MIVFRYKKERINSQTIVARPVADISLQHKNGTWIEFHPYIDSGADVSLIPLTLGNLLQLQKIGNSDTLGGISGGIPVYYCTIPIKIGMVVFPCKVAWSQIETVPTLLGRQDIFDRFDVRFRQKELEVDFIPLGE